MVKDALGTLMLLPAWMPLDLVNEIKFQYLKWVQQVIKETTRSKSKQVTCSRGVNVIAANTLCYAQCSFSFLPYNIVQ
jgi:hypothetical protein